MKHLTTNKSRGFTLIELLVVLSLISILASIVMASTHLAKAKARDAVRLHDMRQIRIALELFHENHGRYPGPQEGIPLNVSMKNKSGFKNRVLGAGGAVDTALSPYLSSIPKDPLHDESIYYYYYDPWHCSDNPPGSCNCAGGQKGIVFGFNKSETMEDLTKDTCSGGDMNANNADYNTMLFPGNNGS